MATATREGLTMYRHGHTVTRPADMWSPVETTHTYWYRTREQRDLISAQYVKFGYSVSDRER